MGKKPKKKTARSMSKYPGLEHRMNPRIRAELIDHDYVDKLSDKEKKWLSQFNEEYLSGTFSHSAKDLHKTKKQKRECYNRNNARNRDVFSIFRTFGWIGDGETPKKILEETPTSKESQESVLIELLDQKAFETLSRLIKDLELDDEG